MDGLSAASGVMAVASLAIQLADSVNRLREFIDSIKEAPKEIRSIYSSLSIVSAILNNILLENSQTRHDKLLLAALLECEQHVQALHLIAEELLPGFASVSPLARTWTAVKAVKRTDRIKRFQEHLERAKTTLIMAQQDSIRRFQLEQHDTQQKALSDITHTLESLQAQTSYQSEVVSTYYTNRDDYLEVVFREIRRVSSSWANPIMRSQLEGKLREAVVSTLDSFPEKEDIAWPEVVSKLDVKAEFSTGAPVYSFRSKRKCVARANSTLSTIFGQIKCSSQLYRIIRPGYENSFDKATSQQRKDYVVESSFWLVPSSWLVKFGLSYAVNVQLARSSYAGWNHSLKSFNLVPDSSLIFEFCQRGNIDGVTTLLSKGLASVRDINSEGSTPLHITAANCHPQLCRLLVQEGADLSATKWIAWNQTQKEHRQIETFRVFLSAGEEIDDEDASQDLQLSNLCDRELVEQGIVARPDFIYPSVWLLEQLLSTSKQTPYLYDDDWWSWRLSCALIDAPNQTPVAEVLKHCNPPVIQSAMIHWIWLLDHPDRERIQRADPTNFKRMYKKIGHLHFKAQRFNPAEDDEDISPLGMAMQKSQSFNRFRSTLKELDIDIETFVREEADFLDDGWTEETLLALFMDDYQPTRYADLTCNWCGIDQLWATWCHDEWLWEQRMERIKAKKGSEDPFTEDELRVQREWDAYIQRFEGERVCALCQARGQSIKERDDGDSIAAVVKLGLITPPETLEQ